MRQATGTSTATIRKVLESIHTALPSGMQFYAFRLQGFTPESQFVTNVNVVRSAGRVMALEAYGKQAEQQLEGLTFVTGSVTQLLVSLPAGEAVHLSYAVNFGMVDGVKLAYEVLQYVFLDPDDEYALTLATKGTPDRSTLSDFSAMVRSFRKVKST